MRMKWTSTALACGLMVLAHTASGAEPFDLKGLIRTAIQTNPQILSQQASVKSSQALLKTADWQYYPTPSVSVEKVSSPAEDSLYVDGARVKTLRLQQSLYTWGRLSAGSSKAAAQLQSSEAALEEVKQQLAIRVAQSYVDAVSAAQRVQAYQRGIEAHERFLALIQRRIEQGVSARSEMVLVVSRLEQMRADQMTALATEKSAWSHLTQLVGQDLDRPNVVTETYRPIRVSAAALLVQAKQHSPNLEKLWAQATVAKWEMEEQSASLYPELYVRVERQIGNYAPANSHLPPINRVFVGMTTSLGAGLSSLTRVEALNARYQASLEDVRNAERSLSDEINTSAAQLEATQRKVKALVAAAAQSEDLEASGERQFLAGKKTWLDLMNTSRERIQTDVQLIDAQANALLLKWRLGLFADPVEVVIEPHYFEAYQ